MTKEQYCEHCGNEIIEARFTSPTVKHRFCSTQCTEDFFDARSTASGSVAAPKEERVCPKCGSDKVIMFTSDDDLCQTCGATFPGVLNGPPELDSIRQHLEQKTIALDSYYKLAAEVAPLKEVLKELLTITETNVFNYNEYKSIIERARKLLSK